MIPSTDELQARLLVMAMNQLHLLPEQMTIRNVIHHLDFDKTVGPDKLTFATKRDDEKVMILYQFSYHPLSANPEAAQNIRRPFAMTVTKNNNLVYSIQSVKEMNQLFQPWVEINNHDNVTIVFDGYDGSAEILLFGLIAERLGDNMNA